MAAHQKKARRHHARLVLIDESGLLMAPLVRRTWAIRGETPLLRQKGKHREKVSVAAALCLSPARQRLRLLFQTLENAFFDNVRTAAFLRVVLRHVRGRVVVLWDGGTMHKGDPIHELAHQFRNRLDFERLPPYAPMLNPIEPIWSWLKYGRLANFAPRDAHELNETVVGELTPIGRNQEVLRAFWHASDLPLPRALLL
jgi:putative transposase